MNVVDSLIRLRAEDLSPLARERIHRHLTIVNPEYVRRVRFGRWVGATPLELYLYDEAGGWILLPRGAVGLAKDALALSGQTTSWNDNRSTNPLEAEIHLKLRDYQAQAAQALVENVQGCVVLPCGAGKTVVGCAAIASAQQATLILVHTLDLLEQWRQAVQLTLGIDASTWNAGPLEPRPITIATVQTAIQNDRVLRLVGSDWGACIIDECHHVPAETFRQVLSLVPAKYRWGLTATPTREDGLGCLLELTIGPVVYTLSHQDLVDTGHLVIPRVQEVETGRAYPEAESYTDLIDAMIVDRARNALIVDHAQLAAQDGSSVLVLSGRVDHCHRLSRLLVDAGGASEALTGGTPKKARQEILSRFRDGSLPILCATQLADEGLDVPGLSVVILATPSRAHGRTIQRLGRLMRPHPGKGQPVLIDLIDRHPIARRQANARRRAYREVISCLTPP